MKRSGTKAKYSPMEQASVFMVQFTTMSEDLLVYLILFSKIGLLLKSQNPNCIREKDSSLHQEVVILLCRSK